MKCPDCKTANIPEALFCTGCGRPLREGRRPNSPPGSESPATCKKRKRGSQKSKNIAPIVVVV